MRAIDQLHDLARQSHAVAKRDVRPFLEHFDRILAEAATDTRPGDQEALWWLSVRITDAFPDYSTRRSNRKAFADLPSRVRSALIAEIMGFDTPEDDSDLM